VNKKASKYIDEIGGRIAENEIEAAEEEWKMFKDTKVKLGLGSCAGVSTENSTMKCFVGRTEW
jgi:hypothetical protein